MERIGIIKKLGIFLTLLIGFAAADQLRHKSYESLYLQQQLYEAQNYWTQQKQQEQEAQHSLTPQQQGEHLAKSMSPIDAPTQLHARNSNDMAQVQPQSHPQSQLDMNYVTPQRAHKQGQPLLQARPHPSATASQYVNIKPIWPNTAPTNSDALTTTRFDTKSVATAATAASTATAALSPNSHNKFSADLFHVIAGTLPLQNVVYSPISLQLLLAFVYTGARGETAFQLQQALSLPASILDTEKLFYNFLQTHLSSAVGGGGITPLAMANKMYHSNQLTVQTDMQQRARYFDSDIEATDFGQPNAAAAMINGWVAQKTHNIIRDLLTPEQLDAQTQAILVSAIHFKAKWAKEFSTTDTEQQKFFVSPQRTVNVNMMYNDDHYRYGEFPELDATGVEMAYENSNMSMLILLPNKKNGLAAMEQRLENVDLNSLTARMQMESVTIRIPQFTIDFELDMRGPLKRLGVTDLFTERAELSGFFRSQSSVGVSQMHHKAFLDVNEAGSEAAAASFIKLIPLSLPNRIIQFTVDHPFMFAIRSPQAVFFIGHVVNI